MSIEQMLTEIRKVIAKCTASEKDVYEELVAEAEGWRERLDELKADENGEE